MAMAACYGNYDLSGGQGVGQHHHQQQQQQQTVHQTTRLSGAPPPQKDYSIPLHVDCSVEYELPNAAKPPAGARVEPLLMIHPCYFRKMESQRRSPFVNNMPNSSRNVSSAAGSVITGTATSVTPATVTRRSSRTSQMTQQHHPHPQQHHHTQQQHLQHQLAQQIQQQQMSQMSQQAQYPVVSNAQQSGSTNSQYIEQARRAVIHSHTGQQSNQQPQPQVQNGVASTTSWNQMAAAAAASVASTTSMSGLVGIPGSVNMTGQSMYSKPVGKRDAMLSGGCGMYSQTNDTLSASGRWEPERSPMAAIPRDYQAGPDATPVIAPRNDDKHILSGKYRQYLRAHRLHPYMMATGSVSSTFPQLTASAFPQMQQVTCYNV